MNKAQQILNAVQSTTVKAIGVVFNTEQYAKGQARVYTYKCNFVAEVGRLVVVPSATGFKVVTVVDTDVEIDSTSDIEYKWAIQLINLNNFDELKAKDKVALDCIRADLNRTEAEAITKGISKATINAIKRF